MGFLDFLNNSFVNCLLSNDTDCPTMYGDDEPAKESAVCRTFDTFCENNSFYRLMFLAVYPCILALCLSGNLLNLYIYRDCRLKTSSAVRLLASKALCNVFFVLSVGINFVREFLRGRPDFEHFYWTAHPATMFIANSFGACSVWLTTGISINSFMCLMLPIQFQSWCNMGNTNRFVLLSAVSAVLLQSYYPITREAKLVKCESALPVYEIGDRYSPQIFTWVTPYTQVFYWVHTTTVILLPFVLMMVLSLVMMRKVSCAEHGRRVVKLKKCLVRITFFTTLSYLLFECPNVILFLNAALSGNTQSHGTVAECEWSTATNFLSMMDAAVPFFLYTGASGKFRNILKQRVGLRGNVEATETSV